MKSPTPDDKLSVLLVDDDAALRGLLQNFFQSRQLALSTVADANDLVAVVAARAPSIIVLDLMMPGTDGLAALQQLRASGDTTPVIMLTARAEGVDRIIGLELGADDYLGKPFMPQELLARIHAIWRRHLHIPKSSTPSGGDYRFGRFELDLSTRTLKENGETLRVSNSEYGLLCVLVQHPMETLSRTRLLTLWQGAHVDLSERGIDVPIWRLRRLIEDDPAQPRVIQTIRGVGYMFVPPKSEP